MEWRSRDAAVQAVERSTGRSLTHAAWLSSVGVDDSVGLGVFFAAVGAQDFVAYDVRASGEVSLLKEWALDDLDVRYVEEDTVEVAVPWPGPPLRLKAHDSAGRALIQHLRTRDRPLALILAFATVALVVSIGGRYLYRTVAVEGAQLQDEWVLAVGIGAGFFVAGAWVSVLRLRRRRRFLR